MRNKAGPRTDPSGTPEIIWLTEDIDLSLNNNLLNPCNEEAADPLKHLSPAAVMVKFEKELFFLVPC